MQNKQLWIAVALTGVLMALVVQYGVSPNSRRPSLLSPKIWRAKSISWS